MLGAVNATLLPTSAPRQFHLLAKPSGAVCNLDCSYCFYLSREMLYPGSRFRMAGDKAFFVHIRPAMDAICAVLWAGRAPSELVARYAADDSRRGRNDPCPCGSSRKWKRCHRLPPGTGVRPEKMI